jgi:hypothetical protein
MARCPALAQDEQIESWFVDASPHIQGFQRPVLPNQAFKGWQFGSGFEP